MRNMLMTRLFGSLSLLRLQECPEARPAQDDVCGVESRQHFEVLPSVPDVLCVVSDCVADTQRALSNNSKPFVSFLKLGHHGSCLKCCEAVIPQLEAVAMQPGSPCGMHASTMSKVLTPWHAVVIPHRCYHPPKRCVTPLTHML